MFTVIRSLLHFTKISLFKIFMKYFSNDLHSSIEASYKMTSFWTLDEGIITLQKIVCVLLIDILKQSYFRIAGYIYTTALYYLFVIFVIMSCSSFPGYRWTHSSLIHGRYLYLIRFFVDALISLVPSVVEN